MMMGHTTNTPQKNPPSYRTSYATLNEEIISTTPHPAKTKHEKPRKLAGKQANYDSPLRLSRHKHQQKCLQTSTLVVFFFSFFATKAQTLVTYRSNKGAFAPETLKTATLNKTCGRGADTGKPKKNEKT